MTVHTIGILTRTVTGALHVQMVWTHKGLTNWVRNAAGRVFALLPYRLVDYWKMTKTFKAEDFTLT